MALQIFHAMMSDVGITRSENQDSLGKTPEDSSVLTPSDGLLFIVADGMGGHKGGKVASQVATDIVKAKYADKTALSPSERLREAFAEANRTIYRKSQSMEELNGMGTTCTCLAFSDSTACIAHVGDSRTYRVDNNTISQLTEDHSAVADMQRKGLLTKQEADAHPARSRLYRALGVFEHVDVDIINDIDLSTAEYFLLCTDGLYNHVKDDEMLSIVTSHNPQEACQRLIDLANERGGRDNITVHVIKLERTTDLASKGNKVNSRSIRHEAL